MTKILFDGVMGIFIKYVELIFCYKLYLQEGWMNSVVVLWDESV